MARPDVGFIAPAIAWYDQNAPAVAARYENLDIGRLHDKFVGALPAAPGLLLDVGAGSGRDAAWFAARGYQVMAVEPSAALRALAERRHRRWPVQWIDDQLPQLERLAGYRIW